MYYRGKITRFNFEKFINRQKECDKKLCNVGYNNGLGVDDASKCSNLKQMILTDAKIETALSMARTQGLFSGSFDDLVHFLKAEVDELSLRRSQIWADQSHRVAADRTSRGGGRGNQGRGGRGGYRSRYNQRNNRNRTILTRVVEGRQVHSGNYLPDEYRRLTPSQREAVKALRRQACNQQNSSNNSDGQERRVGISGIDSSQSNSGSTQRSQPASDQYETPTPVSSVSTITAPSEGVGAYLGNHRAGRNNTPQE